MKRIIALVFVAVMMVTMVCCFASCSNEEEVVEEPKLLATNVYFRDVTNSEIREAAVTDSGLSEKTLEAYAITVYVNGGYHVTVVPITTLLAEELNAAIEIADWQEVARIAALLEAEQDLALTP